MRKSAVRECRPNRSRDALLRSVPLFDGRLPQELFLLFEGQWRSRDIRTQDREGERDQQQTFAHDAGGTAAA